MSAGTSWQPQPGGLAELVQCLKDAENGDSATQKVVLEVCIIHAKHLSSSQNTDLI